MNTNLPLSDREIPISVKITNTHIIEGRRNAEDDDLEIEKTCAVALALKEKYNKTFSVDYWSIFDIKTHKTYIPTDPEKFSNWIVDFDCPSKKVLPETFEFVEKH